MAKILFSLFLVLANSWCAAACTLVSREPAAAEHAQKTDLPPCHQTPSRGHDKDSGGCSHQLVSLAERLTDTASPALDRALVTDSPASPMSALARFGIRQLHHQSPPARPRGAAILRI